LPKAIGGNREETKNDVRAIPEVLTVSNIEPPEGIQRDIGTKYLSTWKVHVRRPSSLTAEELMRLIVQDMNGIRGCNVVRYKMLQVGDPVGTYGRELEESDNYQDSPERKRRNREGFNRITKTGPNDAGPYEAVKDEPDWKSAPPGAPGGLEENND
jgi:hypothetical protein